MSHFQFGNVRIGSGFATSSEEPKSDDVSSHGQTTVPAPEAYPGSIVTYKFNGKNYLQWSRSVQMTITGRRKGGFLTGKAVKPAESDAKFEEWNNDDNLVRSWLIASMQPAVGEKYLLHPTAKSIWDAAKATYSTTNNKSALFEIETRLFNLNQGNMTVSEYYDTMSSYWLQLDMYEALPWADPTDAELFREYVDQKRTLRFLLGLNEDLDAAKSRIMGAKPPLGLSNAVAELQREESRRQLMVTGPKSAPEASALTIQKPGIALAAQTSTSEPEVICEHCRKPYHTKERCWLLVGKPADWKPKSKRNFKGSKAHSATTEPTATTGFTKEQMETLQKLFAKANTTGQSSSETLELFSGLTTHQGSSLWEDDWDG
ncbi:hypothetical protein LINPERHAP1_LOCUS36765 [Linum perenne]